MPVLLAPRSRRKEEVSGPGVDGDTAPPQRALLADPVSRPHREEFVRQCGELGLLAQEAELPGPEDVVLLSVVPADAA